MLLSFYAWWWTWKLINFSPIALLLELGSLKVCKFLFENKHDCSIFWEYCWYLNKYIHKFIIYFVYIILYYFIKILRWTVHNLFKLWYIFSQNNDKFCSIMSAILFLNCLPPFVSDKFSLIIENTNKSIFPLISYNESPIKSNSYRFGSILVQYPIFRL